MDERFISNPYSSFPVGYEYDKGFRSHRSPLPKDAVDSLVSTQQREDFEQRLTRWNIETMMGLNMEGKIHLSLEERIRLHREYLGVK